MQNLFWEIKALIIWISIVPKSTVNVQINWIKNFA